MEGNGRQGKAMEGKRRVDNNGSIEGNVEQWQQLTCSQDNDVFTVTYTANEVTNDWVFYAIQVD